MSTQDHCSLYCSTQWSKDWISADAQELQNVEFNQAFTIPGNSELYQLTTKCPHRVYAKVQSEGTYKGVIFAFPLFLIVNTYERKH